MILQETHKILRRKNRACKKTGETREIGQKIREVGRKRKCLKAYNKEGIKSESKVESKI